MKPAIPLLALAALAACAPLRVEREAAASRGTRPFSVVVVGYGPDEAAARARAERQLRFRMKAELERRELAGASPAARVRDWKAVDRALDRVVPGLVRGDAIVAGGDAIVSLRVSGDEFESALARTLSEGRRAPLRVACVPLEVQGDDRRTFELRELYGAALREALEASGLEPLSTDEVYAALDAARVDRMDEDGARSLGASARVAAIVCGTARIVSTEAGARTVIDIVVRDARTGRSLGGFAGSVDPDSVIAVARRQAVVLKRGLGLE